MPIPLTFSSELIFYPVGLLVLWTLLVLGYLGAARFAAVRRGEIGLGYFRSYQGEAPERLAVLERHFRNLLELPLLFYLAAVTAYVTGLVDAWLLGLAWAFVLLRLIHSGVHLGKNVVRLRFFVFLAGFGVLAAIWAIILTRL